MPATETARLCRRCSETKPASDFSKGDGADGLASWCKPCAAEHARAWYRANKGRARETKRRYYEANRERVNERQREYKASRPRQYKAYRLKSFGLTIDDFERMLAEQDGVCAGCLHPPTGEDRQNAVLHVDHCHETGRVRGLLCGRCNTGLGLLRDDPETLHRLAAYVAKAGA